MPDLDVLAVARDWSAWGAPFPESVPRRVDLPAELSDSVCLAVQGVRRCGKSTLLQQLIDHYDLDRGKALECAAHVALRRRFDDISYWRGKGEVDFVVRHEGRITPYQVTWDEPGVRHEAALEDFYEHFPQAEEAVFVTAETFEETLI